MNACTPSSTCKRWSTRSVAALWPSCSRTSTLEPRFVIRPLVSTPRAALSSVSSKRTEICSRRSGRSSSSSARLSSARLAGLVRTMSCVPWPVSVAPGSISGRSAGSTWSAVRCRSGMISSEPCAAVSPAATTATDKEIEKTARLRSIFIQRNALDRRSLTESLREVIVHRDVDGELLAAQDWRNRHVGGGAPEHLLCLPIEHLVSRRLHDGERRELAARADHHAQCHDAFPIVVGRHARITLVLGRYELELEAIALQRAGVGRRTGGRRAGRRSSRCGAR